MSRFSFRRRTEAVSHGRAPVREATAEQIAATGAAGYDVSDPDLVGFRPAGPSGRREVPQWTREKALRASVASYRANPMARAILDTYTSFCVGDSGVTVTSPVPEVAQVAQGFWADHRNKLDSSQELMLRTHLLQGESIYELIVGQAFGTVRRNPIDPSRLRAVRSLAGNPLWPDTLIVSPNEPGGEPIELAVAQADDITGVRRGEAMFWTSFQALETDTRGYPFLAPVLDWLDNYDQVMSNLVDRTALMRFLAYQVTHKGATETELKAWAKERGGYHLPRSGTIEATNENVEWKPISAQPGSYEDTNTSKNILTSVAAGTGLTKTWLSESGDANRGSSNSMAEPVRRRVQGVQKIWLGNMHEMVAFGVDQAVIAGMLPLSVELADGRVVPTSSTIQVTGPKIAAADAKITAQVLNQLSTGLDKLTSAVDPDTGKPVMSHEAARLAARKAWEDFVGVPYREELDRPDADTDDVATAVDDAGAGSNALIQIAT